MKLFKVFAFCAVFGLSACATDSYNIGETAKTKDVNEGNTYVYGEKGQPARQTKQQYPDPADAQQRADKIKEKFFGSNVASAETGKDTTKKEEKNAKKEEIKKTEAKDAKKEGK